MIRGKVEEEKRAPVTVKERTLQGLWATALKIDAGCIGIDDTFFDIGGDSIVAMRLVAAARAQGLSLSIADVFSYARLSDMALVLKGWRWLQQSYHRSSTIFIH
jgi:aryl carrier-like protein